MFRPEALEEESRLRDRRSALGAQLSLQHARSQVAANQVTAIQGLVGKGYISVVELQRRHRAHTHTGCGWPQSAAAASQGADIPRLTTYGSPEAIPCGLANPV